MLVEYPYDDHIQQILEHLCQLFQQLRGFPLDQYQAIFHLTTIQMQLEKKQLIDAHRANKNFLANGFQYLPNEYHEDAFISPYL